MVITSTANHNIVIQVVKLDFKFYLDARWGRSWCIAINNISLFVNEKLGKIPFYSISQKPAFAWFQELVEWSGITTIHFDLWLVKDQIFRRGHTFLTKIREFTNCMKKTSKTEENLTPSLTTLYIMTCYWTTLLIAWRRPSPAYLRLRY